MLHESPTLNEHLVNAALEYQKLGYRCIPLVPGTKQAAIRWKEFQVKDPAEAHIRTWFSAGEPNVAIVTGNGVVVVDVDDPRLLDAVVAHCGDTPMKCRTPRGGIHAYYRMRGGVHYGNSVKINGKDIDLRCEGAYVVAPWSRTEKGSYAWEGDVLPASELPLVKISWLRERKPQRLVKPIAEIVDDNIMVRRARGYLAVVEGSVSGKGGHRQAFRVACVLTQKFSLTPEAAFPLMWEWNERTCEPLWSEQEVRHKLQDAYQKALERRV